MSTLTGRLLAVVTWVAVVAVGALLVWLVISRAGAGLVNEAGTVTAPTVTAPSGEVSPADDTASDQPSPVRRGTWQGEAGVVTAECRGAAISLVGAQPEEDVVVQVLDRGPDRLVVAFRGEDEGPVTVVARCQDGRPVFTASHTTPAPEDSSGDGSEGGAGDD